MKSNRFYNILIKFISIFENILLAIIKAYLNTLVGQGFYLKVVNYAVDKLWDEVVNPFMKIAAVRAGYSYDVKQGKILIEKLKLAEDANDQATYDSTIDDILS